MSTLIAEEQLFFVSFCDERKGRQLGACSVQSRAINCQATAALDSSRNVIMRRRRVYRAQKVNITSRVWHQEQNRAGVATQKRLRQ